jgi:hypothetical protein
MDLPVYTGLLRIERRLYQVGEVELPAPVTLVEAAVFLSSLGVLLAVSRLLGLGLNPGWAWTYVVLPWLATRVSTGAIADRKRLHLWAFSQLRYVLAEPRLLARLRAVREPAQVRLGARVWQPRPRVRRAPRTPSSRWQAMESLRSFQLEVDRKAGMGTNARPAPSSRGWEPPAPRPERWPANGRRPGGAR